jgi:hypothetical protein
MHRRSSLQRLQPVIWFPQLADKTTRTDRTILWSGELTRRRRFRRDKRHSRADYIVACHLHPRPRGATLYLGSTSEPPAISRYIGQLVLPLSLGGLTDNQANPLDGGDTLHALWASTDIGSFVATCPSSPYATWSSSGDSRFRIDMGLSVSSHRRLFDSQPGSCEKVVCAMSGSAHFTARRRLTPHRGVIVDS